MQLGVRTVCRGALAAGGILGLATRANAQLPSSITHEDHSLRPPHNANNAAWAYLEAWDLVPDAAERSALEDMALQCTSQRALTAAERSGLAQHQGLVAALLNATRIEHCDWGADYGNGWEAILPQLHDLRSSVRILRADTVRCVQDGDFAGAADRVNACFHMALHAASDRFHISSLVGGSIAQCGVRLLDECMLPAHPTPASLRGVLPTLQQVIAQWDFYSMRGNLGADVERTLAWLRSQARGPEAAVRIPRLLLGQRWEGTPGAWMSPVWYATIDAGRFERDLDRAERYHAALMAVWRGHESLPALAELEEEAEEGQWGLVAPLVSQSVRRAQRSIEIVRGEVISVRDRVKGMLADGEAGKAVAP